MCEQAIDTTADDSDELAGAGSEARRRLSLLIATFGTDGVLVVRKGVPGVDGADLAPGSALKWPPCKCGSPKCPDYDPSPAARGDG